MSKIFLLSGSLFGASAVMLGAFAAHALKTRLDPNQLAAFQTGVQYQMIHALVLLIVAVLLERQASQLLGFAGIAFILGIVLFCGSLYLLTLTGMRWPGPITPLGGLAFIAGWLMLAASALGRS